ncbi:MAG: gamma-glutamyltransferase, partial [Anaerolineae bacterium]|nr:gamma-glutamyltransferase [Anaerolineae bacterium]
RVGQVVRLPELAATLETVAQEGAVGFYNGWVAEAIAETAHALGGALSLDDLRSHTSTWETPIQTDYRGVTVYECPPNGQGLAALQALNIAEGWELGGLAWDSPERLHWLVEAMRLAFADARYYLADPAATPVPVAGLLSKTYAAERRALIATERAMQPPEFGTPPATSDTVYLSVVDGAGNACAFINSLYMGWGSGIVARGTGVHLQNRGALFSLDRPTPTRWPPASAPFTPSSRRWPRGRGRCGPVLA